MREMKVVDVDGAHLVVADDEGNEFLVLVDEVTIKRLRSATHFQDGPRISPKEIQSQLRSGLSVEEVSALTGATLEQIERYEAPVAAEKEFIISTAQTVPTQHSFENDSMNSTTEFGTLIAHRLKELNATSERWATWREESGNWVIKLEFRSGGIDHDARWAFDQKKRTLQSLNSDAATLTQRGDLSSGLIPKLRAVNTDAIAETVIVETPDFESSFEDVSTDTKSPTADLLDALRKRRSERDTGPAWLKEDVNNVVDNQSENESTIISGSTVSLDSTLDFSDTATANVSAGSTQQVNKKGRASLPSWDDIVFGTKSDEDPV